MRVYHRGGAVPAVGLSHQQGWVRPGARRVVVIGDQYYSVCHGAGHGTFEAYAGAAIDRRGHDWLIYLAIMVYASSHRRPLRSALLQLSWLLLQSRACPSPLWLDWDRPSRHWAQCPLSATRRSPGHFLDARARA